METIIQDYNIPAGGALPLNIPARFFMLMEATYPVNINIIRNNTRVGSVEGVEQGFVHGPTARQFDGIEIQTVGSLAQTVKIAISSEPADYRRLTGAINSAIISTPKEVRSDNGAAFIGGSIATSFAGGDFPEWGIVNPTGSGVEVVVESFRVVGVIGAPTVAAALITTAIPIASWYAGIHNKWGGGAAPAADVRYAGNTAYELSTGWLFSLPPNDPVELIKQGPIVLPAGYSMLSQMALAATANDKFACTVEWYER